MATKYLARTVVEGGRATNSKLDRRMRNRRERRLRFDIEGDVVSGRTRRANGRWFADRLGPLERWLESNVGRGWTNVYREFCDRFDRRTTKGWHLHEHLLGMVSRGRFTLLWAPFHVDRNGILRQRSRGSWARRRNVIASAEDARAKEWAAGRQVIVRGDAVFWTAHEVSSLAPTSAQGRRFTLDESAFWSGLPAELRDTLMYDAATNRAGRATTRPR